MFNRDNLKKIECVLCALPVLVYGIVYIVNLFVSGVDKGDWYGFVNWGFATGIGIFCMICLISIILGLSLKIINDRVLIIRTKRKCNASVSDLRSTRERMLCSSHRAE